jgi:hypothetical protein
MRNRAMTAASVNPPQMNPIREQWRIIDARDG